MSKYVAAGNSFHCDQRIFDYMMTVTLVMESDNAYLFGM